MPTTASAVKSLQSRPTLCNPIDGSPPGSPVPGILQARTLECVAISFSNAWKWKVKVKSLSRVWLLATPWTAANQALPSMGFSRQEYWSELPFPPSGDLPDPGIEPASPVGPALAGGYFFFLNHWASQPGSPYGWLGALNVRISAPPSFGWGKRRCVLCTNHGFSRNPKQGSFPYNLTTAVGRPNTDIYRCVWKIPLEMPLL